MSRLFGRPSHKQPFGPITNPNWAAFVMLVTLLSAVNSGLVAFIPLPDGAKSTLSWINISISVILWADFFYMLHHAPGKRSFIWKDYGWMAFLGSFPYLRVLRILWFVLILRKYDKRPRDLLAEISINRDAQGTLLLVLFIVLVVFQSAVVFILYFEAPNPGSNIQSVSDAFWWAFTTVSTVGYGDKYPVTDGGRFVGLSLMFVGIVLFSVITGTLAQWFLGRLLSHAPSLYEESKPALQPDGIEEIKQLLEWQEETYMQANDDLTKKIAELETELKELNHDLGKRSI